MVPAATRSPTASPVTAGPTAVTVPVNSWPGTMPSTGLPTRPCRACRSLWQTPQKSTRMTMSSARGSRRSIWASRRILAAAAEEFSRYGIAGARIDRITAAAKTNKAQVYGYFGSKEGLFDAVMAHKLTTAGVPFDADDLASWAVAIYDEHLRASIHPRW